jgi:hypothetical protein
MLSWFISNLFKDQLGFGMGRARMGVFIDIFPTTLEEFTLVDQ